MLNYESGVIRKFCNRKEGVSDYDRNKWIVENLILEVATSHNSYKTICLKLRNRTFYDAHKYQVGDTVKVGYFLSSVYYEKKDIWITEAELYTIEDDGGRERPQGLGTNDSGSDIPRSVDLGLDDMPE